MQESEGSGTLPVALAAEYSVGPILNEETPMRFLADLALFVEVANTGNFSRAAAALGMPASTLSRRISVLEQELGFQLIHRSSRMFTLTDALQIHHWSIQSLLCQGRNKISNKSDREDRKTAE